VGERYLDTVEVTGSIPVSPTSTFPLVSWPVGDLHQQAIVVFWEQSLEEGVGEIAVAVDPAWRRVRLATALITILAEVAVNLARR
jgi:hypothetical protein